DQVHPLIDTCIGFFSRRNQLFWEVNYERNTAPFFLFFGDTQEETAEQGSQSDEITRRSGLVEIRVLDIVVDLQPLEKAFLHFARTEGEAITDVVEKQASAFWEKSPNEKRF